jgi:hypothetical protein
MHSFLSLFYALFFNLLSGVLVVLATPTPYGVYFNNCTSPSMGNQLQNDTTGTNSTLSGPQNPVYNREGNRNGDINRAYTNLTASYTPSNFFDQFDFFTVSSFRNK